MNKLSMADAGGVVHGHRKIKSHLGMRGVAASLVVMYHIGFGLGFHFDFERRNFVFGRSYLFVDLFFILSGFIISYANKADRTTALNRGEAMRFFKSRFARIYPLHFVCLYALVLTYLVESIAGAARGKQAFTAYWPTEHITALIAQTALVQSAGPDSWIDWNIPSWSISAEVFAYLAFVLLVNMRARSPRVQLLLLVAIPLGFYSYVFASASNLDIVAEIAPLRCMAGFSLGMLLFYLRERLEPVSDLWINAVQGLSLAVVLGDLALGWNDLIVIPAFTLLVYSTWSDRGMLSRFLATPPVQDLGEISYSIYLTHVPVIAALAAISPHVAEHFRYLPEATSHAIFIGVVFVAVYIVSRVTYLTIEQAGRERVLKMFAAAKPRISSGTT